MPFVKMRFKDQPVFVEVDERGELIVEEGRARMKYRIDDDRIYNPLPSNIKKDKGRSSASGAKTRRQKKPSEVTDERARPIPDGAVIAYTDGACLDNPGPAGLGFVIIHPDGTRVQRGAPIGQGTNNIAELQAIVTVLDLTEAVTAPVVIFTDSEYAIGVLTKGWKAKANLELIAATRAQIAGRKGIELRKVPAHSGVAENELVDRLARRAATEQEIVEELD